jgi:fructokinase
MYGAIEAGGTKFVCAIGTGPEKIVDEIRFPTTHPEETINQAINFFKKTSQQGKLQAIGIGSFGPIDLDIRSPKYGYIVSTPKNYWENTNIVGIIRKTFNVPMGFDTDVNAAALGEHEWGAARGLSDFIYLTIGTGIGGGGMINGQLLHGLMHPEMGHINIPHDFAEDPFKGCCPYHGDCFEGLASGPAIKTRWKMSPEMLENHHEAWNLEAKYIALAVTNYICTLSPQRVIIGGGIMNQKQLLPLIHQQIRKNLNNYIKSPEILQNIEKYVVLPALGNQSGIMGAIALAKQADQKSRSV